MGKAFTKAVWGDYKPKENGVPVTIVVKGKELGSANIPLLVQNQTYVPLRSITDAIGAAIKWNASTQTASVMLQNCTVGITARRCLY